MSDKFLNKYQSPKLDERSLMLRRLIIRAFEGGQRGHYHRYSQSIRTDIKTR